MGSFTTESILETTDAVFQWKNEDHIYTTGAFGSRDVRTRTVTVSGWLNDNARDGKKVRATLRLELSEADRRMLKEEL